MEEASCCHCGKYFIPDPRQKNPRYCGELPCQRARKSKWQREKIRSDPDYRANQRQCQQDWSRSHSGYWQRYRQRHPDQARRNRDLQKVRNARRNSRSPGATAAGVSMIAKMDASKPLEISGKTTFSGQFWLVPVIAKMDALKVNLYTIAGSCE
jgi:hypothetical protein